MPFLYRLNSEHTLSIKQLRHALHLLLIKHLSLRTALVFDDEEKNLLMQRIIDFNADNETQLFHIHSEHLPNRSTTHSPSSTMRNVTLNSSILLKGSSVDVTLFTTQQISPNDLLCDKDIIILQRFIMHCLIFHLCMCFSMISIKLTQLVNCPLMMTPTFPIP